MKLSTAQKKTSYLLATVDLSCFCKWPSIHVSSASDCLDNENFAFLQPYKVQILEDKYNMGTEQLA